MSTSESKMDFFEVGDLTALVCTEPNMGEAVRATLRELGFKFHTAESAELAIERTRYQSYDIIVVQETFAGSTLKSNGILNYFATLPMAQRRNSMLVLVGSGIKTLDAMQAFGYSVQLVVNTMDLPNLTAILKKSWSEFQSLYKVYKDAFASLGEK
jgi:hypothetical protein